MLKPVMSPGRRSGVHCTRANRPPTACARAFARVVFPSPGRSSNDRWPRANKHASTSSVTSSLPISAELSARRSSPTTRLPSPGECAVCDLWRCPSCFDSKLVGMRTSFLCHSEHALALHRSQRGRADCFATHLVHLSLWDRACTDLLGGVKNPVKQMDKS